MKFTEVCSVVKDRLKHMSLIEKVILFEEFFESPVKYKDGIFYYSGKESNETRVSDYLAIREHWMNVHEFDKLYYYFKGKDESNLT